jgi:NDP-sugar pyrophosphorylase family protein
MLILLAALILVGGFGTRLRPLVRQQPISLEALRNDPAFKMD